MSIKSWMPMYWADFLSKTSHLSASETGAYCCLIGHYWLTGSPLPASDDLLRRISRMEKPEWSKSRNVILAFFILDGSVWRHERIDEEIEKALLISERRSKCGANGAKSRWQPDSKTIANAMANDCQNNAKPHGKKMHTRGEGITEGKVIQLEVGVETDEWGLEKSEAAQ